MTKKTLQKEGLQHDGKTTAYENPLNQVVDEVKRVDEQTYTTDAQKRSNNKVYLVIDSSGVYTTPKIDEGSVRRVKLYENEPSFSRLVNNLGFSTADPTLKRFRENYLMELPDGDKIMFTLPAYMTNDGKYISVFELNPTLCKNLMVQKGKLESSKAFKNQQNELVNTYVPAFQHGFSVASLLPLLTNREQLNFRVRLELYSVVSEALFEESANDIIDSYAISTTYDRVVADDEQGLDMSVLNQGIIAHPLVSPLLGKLFSNMEKKEQATLGSNDLSNDQQGHESGRHPQIMY